jgi:hypothetical protein
MDLINGNTHTHLMCLINAVIRNAVQGWREGRTIAVSSSTEQSSKKKEEEKHFV